MDEKGLETRPFGTTGESVTVIGLGGACLDRSSFEDGVATVRRALELGINYIDTSPYYGYGASQAIIGEALDGGSESYLLATKIGHLDDPPLSSGIQRRCERSLRAIFVSSVARASTSYKPTSLIGTTGGRTSLRTVSCFESITATTLPVRL